MLKIIVFLKKLFQVISLWLEFVHFKQHYVLNGIFFTYFNLYYFFYLSDGLDMNFQKFKKFYWSRNFIGTNFHFRCKNGEKSFDKELLHVLLQL
jgi:hypothetical protein